MCFVCLQGSGLPEKVSLEGLGRAVTDVLVWKYPEEATPSLKFVVLEHSTLGFRQMLSLMESVPAGKFPLVVG